MLNGISYEQLRHKINNALNPDERWSRYVRELYDDRVVYEDDDGELYEAPYTVGEDGEVSLGEDRRVEVEYVPAKLVMALKAGEAPTEIQVIPFGSHETGKGDFVLDEEGMAAILADFEGRANDMVIDYEHQTLTGGEAPAAGWIKKLVNKGRDGLWAVVEWTERAKEYLKNREYRYLSPVFLKTIDDGKVVRLLNAALTNTPAIDGMVPVVNRKGDFVPPAYPPKGKDVQTHKKEEKKMLEKLLKLLALKEGATEEQALEAVKGMAGEAKVLVALKEPLGIKPGATADEAMQVVAAMKASLEAYEAGSKNIKSVMAAHTEVMQALGLKEGASVSEVKGADREKKREALIQEHMTAHKVEYKEALLAVSKDNPELFRD
jgi:phage I-like protein